MLGHGSLFIAWFMHENLKKEFRSKISLCPTFYSCTGIDVPVTIMKLAVNLNPTKDTTVRKILLRDWNQEALLLS